MKTITTTLSIFALLLSTTAFSGVKNGIDPSRRPPMLNMSTNKTDIDPSRRPPMLNMSTIKTDIDPSRRPPM